MKALTSLSILIILTFLGTDHENNKMDGSSYHVLYDRYFQSYDQAYDITGSEDLKEMGLKIEAHVAFNTGRFEAAAAHFAELVTFDKTASNYFYMGLSYLENADTESAIRYFNVTINHFDEYDIDAKWYLALAHLSDENEEAAISTLVSLTLENSKYKEQASAILKQMGLSTNSLDYGIIREVHLRPKDDAPDGALPTFVEERQIQYGIVESETDGYRYYFLTDQPIRSLHEGSEVEMIIITKYDKRRLGFAFILGDR